MRKRGLIIWNLIFLTVFNIPLFTKQICLYVDWKSEARGQELFSAEGSYFWRIQEAVKEHGFELQSFDPAVPLNQEAALWMFWNLGPPLRAFDFSQLPSQQLVLFLFEPPTVQPELYDARLQAHFGRIYTWEDDRVDGVRTFKFYYPVLKPRLKEIPSFEEKKFCTLIATRLTSRHPKELYSEREKTIRFFEAYEGELDLYGRFWEKRKFKSWKGTIADKLDILKRYRFSICYENMKDVQGYITEKIFDCFAAGVVPIYWGASNISDWIPADCFLDRRSFKDHAEMRQRMKQMTREEYLGYLERAARFLESEVAQRFSEASFIDLLKNLIETNN